MTEPLSDSYLEHLAWEAERQDPAGRDAIMSLLGEVARLKAGVWYRYSGALPPKFIESVCEYLTGENPDTEAIRKMFRESLKAALEEAGDEL